MMKLLIVENGKKWEEIVDVFRFVKEIKKNVCKIVFVGIISGVVVYLLISMLLLKYVLIVMVLLKVQVDNVLLFLQVEDFDFMCIGYYEM